MPSNSYGRWTTPRRNELDELERAHSAIGGTGRGRRYATLQINHAYTVLLASQFQGYCRDLHSESVDYLVPWIQPTAFQASVRELLATNLQLMKGNAQPGCIGADFGRFGVNFWDEASKSLRDNAQRGHLEWSPSNGGTQ